MVASWGPVLYFRQEIALRSPLIRFSLVGIANTFFGLTTIYAAKLVGWNDVAANSAGYAVGISISFFINKTWTFSYRGPTLRAAYKFALITGAAYIANLAAVLLCIHAFGVNPYAAQLIGVPVYAGLSYIGYRKFAFEKKVGK